MPYLFALLLVANGAVLGYFMFVDKGDKEDASVVAAKSALSKPVNFVNQSAEIPPEIGKK